MLEERTEGGAASLVAGLYYDVVSNALVVVIWGVVLQDGKQVVASCMSVVDRSQEMDVGRCSGIMGCGRHLVWIACWRGSSVACISAHHPW